MLLPRWTQTASALNDTSMTRISQFSGKRGKRTPITNDRFVKKGDKLYFYMIKSKSNLFRVNPNNESDIRFLKEDSNKRATEQLKKLYEESGQDSSKVIFKNKQVN